MRGWISLRDLPPRDAGFARALASETLRHMGALDAVLRNFMAKPLAPHKAGAASEILLLGACELLILKVRAACRGGCRQPAGRQGHQGGAFQAADQCRAAQGRRAKATRVLSGLDRERLSTPDWLWTRWTAQYGAGTARADRRAPISTTRRSISSLKSPDAVFPQSEALFGPVRRLSDRGPHRRPARLRRRRLVGAGRRRHPARAAAGRCRGQDG